VKGLTFLKSEGKALRLLKSSSAYLGCRYKSDIADEPCEWASELSLLGNEHRFSFVIISRPDVGRDGVAPDVGRSKAFVKVSVNPRLRPELLIKLNSPMLEVELIVAPHTGVEVGGEVDVTNLDEITTK